MKQHRRILSSSPPARARAAVSGPLIEEGTDTLRIADVQVPRRPVPVLAERAERDAFRSFCCDDIVAAALTEAMRAVRQSKPFCLRGATGASKTSITELIGALTGRGVLSVTLSSESRVGDLVGRFVPLDPLASLPISLEDLAAQADLLTDRARAIVEAATAAGRALTPLEVAIVRNEQALPMQALGWQDGAVPAGMRQGRLVALHEANLPSSELLERINPVFDPHYPTLHLAEYDGRTLRPGSGVHPDFLVCATVNPSTYEGRRSFSPALADRFTFIDVPEPGEEEFRRLALWAVFGEAEPVRVDDRLYSAPNLGAPRHDVLESVPGIRFALEGIARLQGDLATRAKRPGKDKPVRLRAPAQVFSRRLIIDWLDFVAAEVRTAPIDSLARLQQVFVGATRFAYSSRGTAVLGADGFQTALVAHGFGGNQTIEIAVSGASSGRGVRRRFERVTGLAWGKAPPLRTSSDTNLASGLAGVVVDWMQDVAADCPDLTVKRR